jgi:hypothetical protein
VCKLFRNKLYLAASGDITLQKSGAETIQGPTEITSGGTNRHSLVGKSELKSLSKLEQLFCGILTRETKEFRSEVDPKSGPRYGILNQPLFND